MIDEAGGNEWWDGYVRRGEVHLVVGKEKVGKTNFLTDLAAHCWFGNELPARVSLPGPGRLANALGPRRPPAPATPRPARRRRRPARRRPPRRPARLPARVLAARRRGRLRFVRPPRRRARGAARLRGRRYGVVRRTRLQAARHRRRRHPLRAARRPGGKDPTATSRHQPPERRERGSRHPVDRDRPHDLEADSRRPRRPHPTDGSTLTAITSRSRRSG